MSNPLRLHGLQHARLLCPSLCAGVCPNSCPLCLSSHSLLQPSPFAFNLSQHQGIFQWVGSSHQMAKVLKLQLQHQSFSWINIQGWFPLGLTGWISHLSKELPRVFSSTTVCKPQFSGAQPSLWSNSHIYIWLLVKPLLWLYKPLSAKWWFAFQYAV